MHGMKERRLMVTPNSFILIHHCLALILVYFMKLLVVGTVLPQMLHVGSNKCIVFIAVLCYA
jgi:hypothetical protein